MDGSSERLGRPHLGIFCFSLTSCFTQSKATVRSLYFIYVQLINSSYTLRVMPLVTNAYRHFYVARPPELFELIVMLGHHPTKLIIPQIPPLSLVARYQMGNARK